MNKRTITAALAAASGSLLIAAPGAAVAASGPRADPGRATQPRAAMREARQILRSRAARAPRARFTAEENVFLPSTIRVRDLATPGKANATVPAFRGAGPDGRANVWYIITEAADYSVAKAMGVNYAPKLVHGRGTGGSQQVTLRGGRMRFPGAVDFSPERFLHPGGEGSMAFPPGAALPGAVGDAEWSSLVVLPSGSVVNVAAVSNPTGNHDRLVRLDRSGGEATIELLDGWQGGDRRYYHFVTDSSDAGAATIEQGVYTPRLAKLPRFGASRPSDRSALLGFSPNANGEVGANNPERQGLSSTIVDGDRDPVNVFPLDPDNDKRIANNYSPMWDAHISQWTQTAIDTGQRRAIRSFEDLEGLVDRGLVMSAEGSDGRPNPFVAGLRATNLIINCPVIAQPFETVKGEGDAPPPAVR
jgi:hypothetical protein